MYRVVILSAVLPILCLIASSIWVLVCRSKVQANKSKRKAILNSLNILGDTPSEKRFIGFFHPYCNAGAGGERVLWTAIAFLQRTEPDVIIIVYYGDKDITKEDIIRKVKARFDISLDPASLDFVFLKSRYLVDDTTWKRFTLLGQSLGSVYLAWEAISHFAPDLFIDTMGYAFTFYLVRLLGQIPVGAYVHYPTISTEMLHRVQMRTAWHTNSDTISSSAILSKGKQLYYRIFMFYYSLSLRNASFLMVNSTWTKNHVDAVLDYSNQDLVMSTIHSSISGIVRVFFAVLYINTVPLRPTRIVYPSCDTKQMSASPLTGRSRTIISLAQFRPEKDHAAQLHALATLFKSHPEYRTGQKAVKLVLMGSSRDADDAARVEILRVLAVDLDLMGNVEFAVNVPYPDLLDQLSRGSIGISTMVDEHFGINIVEFMAAGLIPVVHASGGPLYDIVVPRHGERTGFHCTSPATFADALHAALSLSNEEELAMRKRAREHAVECFSEREFELSWDKAFWSEWREKIGLVNIKR